MTPSIGFSFYRLEHGRVNISAMVIWHEIWHVHVSLEEYLIHSRTLSILENKLNDNKILLSLPLPLSLFSNTTFPLFKKVERKKRVCRKNEKYSRVEFERDTNDTEYVHIYIYIFSPQNRRETAVRKQKASKFACFPLFSFSRKYARSREKARVKKKKGRETNNLRSVRIELDSDHYIRSLAIRWRVDSGG